MVRRQCYINARYITNHNIRHVDISLLPARPNERNHIGCRTPQRIGVGSLEYKNRRPSIYFSNFQSIYRFEFERNPKYEFRMKEKELEERKRQRDAEAHNDNMKRSKPDMNGVPEPDTSEPKENGMKKESSEASEIDRLEPLNDVMIPTSR